uniref:Uncharacterized protein n=1 Tax=Salix viminalis TaxID=40686 RepID=A0A6N2KAK6_SALVM
MCVTIGGKNLKDTIVNCQDTNIKSTAAKIKYKNVLFTALLIQTIGDSSGSWLINNSSHIESSYDTGILGSLPLGIIEVCCKMNKTTRSITPLGCFLHLGQNHSTNLFRTEDLSLPILDLNLNIRLSILTHNLVGHKFHILLHLFILKPAKQQTLSLDIKDGPLGIDSRLILGSFTDQPLTVSKSHPGWGNTVSLVICYDFHMTVLVNTNT